MTDQEEYTYNMLEYRCELIGKELGDKMLAGSREYPEMQALLTTYIDLRTAADRLSLQTDSSLGAFDEVVR